MKTNNYLGKRDENRGIIIFFIVFFIALAIAGIIVAINNLKQGKETEGITKIDEMSKSIKSTMCDIEKFEIDQEKLILEGTLNEKIKEYLIGDIEDIQIILKDNESDKYMYDLDYYISTDSIVFSTIDEESNESNIKLNEIEPNEYFVFLRIKYDSPNSESGYRYEYYTLNNTTSTDALEYENAKIYFSNSAKVESYLTINYN